MGHKKSGFKKNALLVSAALGTAASLWGNHPGQTQAATYTNTTSGGTVQQGTNTSTGVNNPAVTISLAGQTALSNFFGSGAFTELQPGTQIILHDGLNNAAVQYNAPSSATSVQLGNPNFAVKDTNPGTPTAASTANIQTASAIAAEWHQEGSVDGFYDLLNDQIGYNPAVGTISNPNLRGPSAANITLINSKASFTAYSTSSINGFNLNFTGGTSLAQTYNQSVYNLTTGANLLGGQNRVQFSIGEYPTEALAVSGTASPLLPGTPTAGYTIGSAGYGQGNTALKQPVATLLTSLGYAGAKQQLQPVSAANESTDKNNPKTGTAYTAGPWNTAGADNITSTAFAATAVTYSANPGTGLQRIDLGDAQWLQTTGRLQNGALFNVVARTVDTGQRVVFAANTGVDPAWAVGSNDDGNTGGSTAAATAQHSIGPSLRYDGKTSGSEAAYTIQQSRMGVGALSVPEATTSKSSAPVRALDVDFNNLVDVTPANDTGGTDGTGSFVRANFDTIVSDGVHAIQDGGAQVNNGPSFPAGTVVPHYGATLISHFNTVKDPNLTALQAYEAANPNTLGLSAAQYNASSWAALQTFDPAEGTYNGSNGLSLDVPNPTLNVTGIKGDTYGDVASVLSNVLQSNIISTNKYNSSNIGSVNNPGEGLLGTGFLLPQLLNYTRNTDGGPLTYQPLSAKASNAQAQAYTNYAYLFTSDGTNADNSQTSGSGPQYYGITGVTGGTTNVSNGVLINGNILITAKNAAGQTLSNGDPSAVAGNYLFGNFNQNGYRDYSAVQEAVNAALSLYRTDSNFGASLNASSSIFTQDNGVPNSTVVTSITGTPGWVNTLTNTKGDLIVLGDFNGDGKFDGADLYLLATGASLASSNTATTLNYSAGSFADVVRDPNNVLRKNAALDYVNSQLNSTSVTYAAAFLRRTGAAILTLPNVNTSSGVPAGAVALGADPVSGLWQYTYDLTGTYAFDKHDVNRDGVVDFNDAVLADQYNTQSYQNLSQSLAATQQTPVAVAGTSQPEPLNLVAVQQIDGEAAIGQADVNELNAGLTGSGPTNWYAYTLNKSGPWTITWQRSASSVTVYPGAALQVSAGTIHVQSSVDPFTDSNSNSSTASLLPSGATDTSKSLAITITGGTLEYTGATTTGVQLDRLASLNIASGSVVLDPAANHANRTLLETGSLILSGAGTLDLGTNDLDIQSGTLSTVVASIKQAYNSGSWNGAGGITSSTAVSNHLLALGVIQNNQSGGTLFNGSHNFDGITPGAGDILVKSTYYGDANLDGQVTSADYTLIDAGYLSHGTLTGWLNGDFNYDNVINGSDYTLIDNAFNTQGASLSAVIAGASAIASPTAQIAGSGGTTAVPEPATAGLFGVAAAIGLLGRPRRRFSRDW